MKVINSLSEEKIVEENGNNKWEFNVGVKIKERS